MKLSVLTEIDDIIKVSQAWLELSESISNPSFFQHPLSFYI